MKVESVQSDPAPNIPSFRSVIKSSDVEDPINQNFNRPLAYGFVLLVYRTRLTPNQVTLLSLFVGALAAACWAMGSPGFLVAGGLALWASAILDGADGILARVKGIQSQIGRALDGTADMAVAVMTLAAAAFHLWTQRHQKSDLLWTALAVPLSIVQIYLYDFYKELYLKNTRIDRRGEGTNIVSAERLHAKHTAEGAPWIERFVLKNYVDLLHFEHSVIRLTNSKALALENIDNMSAQNCEQYRKLNKGPMQIWVWLSLAPHCYLFSIFGMFNLFEWYLGLRLTLGTVAFVVGLFWQRRATHQSLALL